MPAFDKEQYGAACVITCVVMWIAPLLLPIVVGLLMPGRKGTMRTKRMADWTGLTTDEARQLLLERLAAQRFHTTSNPTVDHFTAQRDKAASWSNKTAIHTHASKPLNAEFSIERHVAGTTINVTMWTPDLVITDTGEGAHIDQVLDQLLHEGNTPAPAPPPVPNTSLNSTVSIWGAGLIWAAAVCTLIGRFSLERTLGVLTGCIAGLIVPVGLGIFGLRDVIFRPGEMRGAKRAILGIVLGICGAAAMVGVLYLLHGDTIGNDSLMEFLRKVLPKENRS